ncbi:MAG: flagellar basal body-associated FliL family protein [Proteobacteria bacterium]|nr:flagellar basal body-associated FliL family protein [Pseudomonadota bacterium]
MSKDKADKDDAKGGKKGKGKGMVMMLGGALALMGAGGGGAFALMKAGVIGGHTEKVKEDNAPKLIKKGEKDPFAPKQEGAKEGEATAEVEGEGGSPYHTLYYSFADEFTSNLRNSAGLVQVSIAASTHRDGRVLLWLKKHELAIRSAILAVLADTPEEDVVNMEGKARLQHRIAAAINKVLTDTEGFGGIDNVYFKSFLVQ